MHDTDPVHDTDPAPPSSKRSTMPYLEAISEVSRARVLVAHADDVRRKLLCLCLESAGHAVVPAQDAQLAAMLMSRVRPCVVVADVETIAPDFEPVRPALEALFGDEPEVPVVLLSTHRRPDMPDVVKALVSPTIAADELITLVEQIREPQ